MKKYLEIKKVEGNDFYFIKFGSEDHGRPSFLMWINKRLVQNDESGSYIEFPIRNAKIVKTEKGNLVLRPEEGWTTFAGIGVECGFRGSSSFEILEPKEEIVLLKYYIYKSPRGSVGVSCYGLVSVKTDKVVVKWSRSGRLYGKSSTGISVYYADGRVETLDEIPDGLEAIEELKKELE